MSSPRIPKSCPPNFSGRYTVVSGDNMSLIAQRFNVSLQALINANPHISNPDEIFPGDVLCVPKKQPKPRKKCPCPVTLIDFINRRVEVTTVCNVVTGKLTSVDEDSITLQDPKTSVITIVRCKEICFVRILRCKKGRR